MLVTSVLRFRFSRSCTVLTVDVYCESPRMMNCQLAGRLKNGQQTNRNRCWQKLTGLLKSGHGQSLTRTQLLLR